MTPLSSDVKSLLSLTGQVHSEEFPYDQVYVVRVADATIDKVVGALGRKGKRVVDIAVVPEFRKQGIATALISIAGVDTAYVVSPEAECFWEHIGWLYVGSTTDKDTEVKVYMKEW